MCKGLLQGNQNAGWERYKGRVCAAPGFDAALPCLTALSHVAWRETCLLVTLLAHPHTFTHPSGFHTGQRFRAPDGVLRTANPHPHTLVHHTVLHLGHCRRGRRSDAVGAGAVSSGEDAGGGERGQVTGGSRPYTLVHYTVLNLGHCWAGRHSDAFCNGLTSLRGEAGEGWGGRGIGKRRPSLSHPGTVHCTACGSLSVWSALAL